VRVDAFDVLETLPGKGRQAERDRHDDLAADLELVLEQQVVVLADRAVDDVLDRDHAGGGVARRDDLEHLAKAAQRDAIDVAEGGQDGVLGEGTGFAGIGDGQDRRGRTHRPIPRQDRFRGSSMASAACCIARCAWTRPAGSGSGVAG
jgi:hypothetical protein